MIHNRATDQGIDIVQNCVSMLLSDEHTESIEDTYSASKGSHLQQVIVQMLTTIDQTLHPITFQMHSTILQPSVHPWQML